MYYIVLFTLHVQNQRSVQQLLFPLRQVLGLASCLYIKRAYVLHFVIPTASRIVSVPANPSTLCNVCKLQ